MLLVMGVDLPEEALAKSVFTGANADRSWDFHGMEVCHIGALRVNLELILFGRKFVPYQWDFRTQPGKWKEHTIGIQQYHVRRGSPCLALRRHEGSDRNGDRACIVTDGRCHLSTGVGPDSLLEDHLYPNLRSRHLEESNINPPEPVQYMYAQVAGPPDV